MNAPFRDLLASHSLFANSEWDERMAIIDPMFYVCKWICKVVYQFNVVLRYSNNQEHMSECTSIHDNTFDCEHTHVVYDRV